MATKYLQRKIGALVIAIVIIVIVSVYVGEVTRYNQVLYGFEDGFIGNYKIQFNQPLGKRLPIINGEIVFNIPASGVLILSTSDPITALTSVETAQYKNGTKIAIWNSSEKSDSVRFRTPVVFADGTHKGFVGTDDDGKRIPFER